MPPRKDTKESIYYYLENTTNGKSEYTGKVRSHRRRRSEAPHQKAETNNFLNNIYIRKESERGYHDIFFLSTFAIFTKPKGEIADRLSTSLNCHRLIIIETVILEKKKREYFSGSKRIMIAAVPVFRLGRDR